MIISYDKKADAAYIYLTDDLNEKSEKQYPIDPEGGMIVIDINREGKIVGIEVLDASKKLHSSVLAKAADMHELKKLLKKENG